MINYTNTSIISFSFLTYIRLDSMLYTLVLRQFSKTLLYCWRSADGTLTIPFLF